MRRAARRKRFTLRHMCRKSHATRTVLKIYTAIMARTADLVCRKGHGESCEMLPAFSEVITTQQLFPVWTGVMDVSNSGLPAGLMKRTGRSDGRSQAGMRWRNSPDCI